MTSVTPAVFEPTAQPVSIETDSKALVRRAAKGDRASFELLVRQHYARAVRVAYGIVGSREDAEDVVQEAFVRVHRRIADFRADSAFYTWLYRIVVNLGIDLVRKQKRERRADVEDEQTREALSRGARLWPKPERDNPHYNSEMGELRKRLDAAFKRLPEIHQGVLVLREVEGLSYEEISRTLGIKKGTVMSRLFHARKSMQKHLGVAVS